MMKKTCFLFLLLLCGVVAIAQDFEIVSVESLPADMSAREEMKTDHNDRQCALLRVATQNIAPNMREGFSFVPDLGSEVVERATRDGEIWLWVSPGLKYLRIKHRDWGQYELRLQDYVTRVEALHTYKVTIIGTLLMALQEQGNASPTQQYLAFQISPTNAVLEVEGELWEVASDGSAMKFVNFGTYNYRVQAPNYHPEIGKVTVNDPDKTQKVTVTLEPDFVEVTLKVDADAEIWVNNEKKGTRTWTGNLGKGNYKIECKQAGHETSMIAKEITADMNGQTIDLPRPTPIYGSLNIESTPNFAKVFIDGKEVGETPKFVSELLVGEHEIKLKKEGYEDYVETLSISKGERKHVVSTMKNSYDVKFSCNVSNATLSIDNVVVGKASNTYKMSYGNHLIKITAIGYLDYSETITVDANNVKFVIEMQGIVEKAKSYFNAGNYSQAMVYFKQAAEQGDAEAQFEVGRMYAEGIGRKKDCYEAVEWYQMAVKQNNANAKAWLSDLYIIGCGVELDYDKALKLIRESVSQGNAYGMNNLGYMYNQGYGVVKNNTEAVKWYRKSAELGDATGMSSLGYMYLHGEGVSINYSEALKYYRMSADKGNSISMGMLGWMYSQGLGVGKDKVEAVNWYRKSAELGNALGQYNLGMMYEYGQGVPINKTEAIKWYRLAAEQGHEKAQNRLKQLTK